MITLLKNADVYTPEHIGINDILIVNDKIEKIDKNISITGLEYNVIDLSGKIVTPGFIDKHVHVTGGGGEFGFASFAYEIHPQDLLKVGTTTVVGLLGTDSSIKEVTQLYGKTKQLDTYLTAYMLTGAYRYPSKTILDNAGDDIVYIDKIIGCKLALSDDRGSYPTENELLKLITDVRRGGMTTGKAGILHIHLGVLPTGIGVLRKIIRENPRLAPHISITHCSRSKELFYECMEYAKEGGNLDMTTGGSKFTDFEKEVEIALNNNVPLEKITFSTDGGGGVTYIDEKTGEQKYRTGAVDSNLREVKNIVAKGVLPLEKALAMVTVNPARELKLNTKGHIQKGYDADIIVFDKDLNIKTVIAKGKIQINN